MALESKPQQKVRDNVPVHLLRTGDSVRVNILIPSDLRKVWKTAALERDTTVTDLIVTAMSQLLKI